MGIKNIFKKKNEISSSSVEAELEVSRLRDLLNFKILLLGAGECGKSTVLKQVKLIHKIGFTEEELRSIGVNLRRNALQCMQVLLEACATISPPIPLESEGLADNATLIRNFEFDSELAQMPPTVVQAITKCWESPELKGCYDRRDEFWCLDSVEYYFENIERFCDADFDPDEQDCVMARIITTGIVTTELSNPPIDIQLIDVGGQRNERRKWMHCFDNCTAILYIVNLNGYSSVLYEDSSVNRMHESLEVFSNTLNSEAFANTPIFLILNKKDLFEETLRKKPLTMCFPDYEGNLTNAFEAMEFVVNKYRSRLTSNPERLKHFAIAARYRRDVKTVWEDIIKDLKEAHSKDIQEATKGLAKSEKKK